MTLAEEKRKIVESLASISTFQHDDVEIKQKLNELFTCDTHNRKLYKYRSFDNNNFSLTNLSSNTLHCSKPSVLNDLFDCKLGVSFCELFDALCKPSFDKVSAVLDKLSLSCDNQLDVHVCDDDEQAILNGILSNEHWIQFCNSNRNCPITNRQIVDFLLGNPGFVFEMLGVFSKDFTNKCPPEVLSTIIFRLFQIIDYNGFMTIIDPQCTFEMFANVIGIEGDFDEIDLFTKVCEKLYSENVSKVTEEIQQALDMVNLKLIEPFYNSFLVGCLSTDYKNRLLWSHYADAHKGFCIEFDFSSFDFLHGDILPLPVLYSNKRCSLLWRGLIEKTQDSINEAIASTALSLLTKDQVWNYENEWRLLLNSTKNEDYQMPKVSCVYLGASISDENREKILEISRKNGFKVMQMFADRYTFDLHAKDVF